jgi:molybdopterin converting factor small subunit
MMDAPDFILEQLKDILSSGQFRNGSQVFDIKTRFIIACTNKTREEFAKNPSLKALMERFPLEHNVIWDNYNEASYNTLLEKRFGVGKVDPIIPYLLQEYSRANITISPRIALDCYEIYEVCGPDSLIFIAEFAKKPTLISEALSKFEATVQFKKMGADIQDLIQEMASTKNITLEQKESFYHNYKKLETKLAEVKKVVVNDDLAQQHAGLVKTTGEALIEFRDRYKAALKRINEEKAKIDEAEEAKSPKKKSLPAPLADNDEEEVLMEEVLRDDQF